MRLFFVAVLTAAAVPAVAADPPSGQAGDALMGCWLERRFVDSESPGWTNICFSGDGVGTQADFDGMHGAEGSFGYEAKDGGLRLWEPDDPQDAGHCAFSVEGTSLTLSACGLRGTYQRNCEEVVVRDGHAVCADRTK